MTGKEYNDLVNYFYSNAPEGTTNDEIEAMIDIEVRSIIDDEEADMYLSSLEFHESLCL